ncbi:MAG: peptidylprolyl isomerase [Jhaorihella sp.]
MPERTAFLPSLALAALMAMPVAAEPPNAETVVARVNGEEIRLGHLIIARASLPQQYQQMPSEVLYGAILDQLIQQTALKQAGPDETPRHVELSLENERRSLLAAEVIEDVLRDAVGEQEVRAAYESRYADGNGGEEYNASHILVETEEEAAAIKAELEAGADFAQTAKEKSTGPSGPNGGELGWFGTGQMVPEFEAAVIALEPGAISDPVKTQFGWHIVILNDKRIAQAPAFDEVREEIAGELQRAAVEAKVAELTDAAEVERPAVEGLTPDMLLDLDLVRN